MFQQVREGREQWTGVRFQSALSVTRSPCQRRGAGVGARDSAISCCRSLHSPECGHPAFWRTQRQGRPGSELGWVAFHPGRAKLLLSREPGDTSTRGSGSAGASPSRWRASPSRWSSFAPKPTRRSRSTGGAILTEPGQTGRFPNRQNRLSQHDGIVASRFLNETSGGDSLLERNSLSPETETSRPWTVSGRHPASASLAQPAVE